MSFSYTPDFGAQRWGYYRYYQTPGATGPVLNRYSIFESLVYGTPTAGRSGRVGFNVGNNLEMKIKSNRDTTGIRKITLIENLTFSGSYDLAKDSLNWSPLSMSGYTTLFKNLRINFSGAWDPYQVDTLGRRINRFEFERDGRIFRRTSSEITLSFSYMLSSKDQINQSGSVPEEDQAEVSEVTGQPQSYIDWTNPWRFSLSYNYRYSSVLTKVPGIRDRQHIQTLGIQGDFNLTPKWKIEVETGIDFMLMELSFTRLRLWRDLHCWDMSLDWIPLGPRKSYMMTLKVKSSVLQDLKITRKTDWRDYI